MTIVIDYWPYETNSGEPNRCLKSRRNGTVSIPRFLRQTTAPGEIPELLELFRRIGSENNRRGLAVTSI
jgi:hypothetical protein